MADDDNIGKNLNFGEVDNPMPKGKPSGSMPFSPDSENPNMPYRGSGGRGPDAAPIMNSIMNTMEDGNSWVDKVLSSMGLSSQPLLFLFVGVGMFYFFWKMA
jgi:hypothetical protein